MKLKTIVISTIAFIRSPKFKGGGRFLINAQSKNELWINPQFLYQVYTNIGLSTETPFQQFVGSTLTYYEVEVTEAQLQENNGKVTVTSPVSNREIEFTTPGVKSIDIALGNMSSALQQSIFSIGVKVDSSWASTITTPATAVPQTPTVEVPEVPNVDMNNNEAPILDDDLGDAQ